MHAGLTSRAAIPHASVAYPLDARSPNERGRRLTYARAVHFRTAAVAFSGFVVLGLPTGMLGIAWPTIRTALDAPFAGLGVLLAAMTITQFGASGLSGLIRDRFGTIALLLVPTILAAGGLALFAFAGTWPAMRSMR